METLFIAIATFPLIVGMYILMFLAIRDLWRDRW